MKNKIITHSFGALTVNQFFGFVSIPCRFVCCCIVFFCGFVPNQLAANNIIIASSAELKTSLDIVKPGDILTFKNGSWRDAQIIIGKGGEPGKPVKIQAESPGGAIFSGSSFLELNAPYVTVDGLLFQKGALKKGSVIQFNSHHAIVQNTAIIDYNPASFETKYYWVFFSGVSNLIDRCYFKGKSNMQPLVGNAGQSSRYNTVTRSFFKDVPYNDANGREIFRIWGYGNSEELGEDGAYFTISSNLFDHADGEGAEIISLKSNHNLVLRNTIIATRGCINIRSGNYNTIRENIVLGQGLNGAFGVRMAGQNHVVQDNYISGCTYGFELTTGEFIDEDLTGKYVPLPRAGTPLGRVPHYSQIKNLTLTGNVVVGSHRQDLQIGGSYKSSWPQRQLVLIPEGCLIESNRFVRPKGGASVVGAIPDTNPPVNRFSFKPNRYAGNLLIGGDNGFAPALDGFKQQPVPGDWSEQQELMNFKVLTPAEVGPDWLNEKSSHSHL